MQVEKHLVRVEQNGEKQKKRLLNGHSPPPANSRSPTQTSKFWYVMATTRIQVIQPGFWCFVLVPLHVDIADSP